MSVMVDFVEAPLKATEGVNVTPEQLDELAADARQAITAVGDMTPSTCIEDRERAGLMSGEPTVEARPSVPGGSDIYGLYVAELTGYFGDDRGDATDHQRQVTQTLHERSIASGGHEDCAARAKFLPVVELIAGPDFEAGVAYAQDQLGEDFDQSAAEEVVRNAAEVVKSGRYRDWSGEELKQVLGDDASRALEVLKPGPHTAFAFLRVDRPGETVDQNKLGGRAFVNDEPYAARIENALAEGPQASWKLKLGRHARELVLHALYVALPNPELHQGNIR